MRLPWEYGLLKILEDFRTCSECNELLPDNLWNFEYLGGGKRGTVCPKCRSAIRQQVVEEQERAAGGFQLTDAQQAFLNRHKIPFDRVFFANGMPPSRYRPIMKARGLEVAVGVTACQRAGHSMRSRTGNCIQCNPAALAFQRRHDAPGYVYIASSRSAGLLKVGLTNDISDREYMLNLLSYGGYSDWGIVESIHCDLSGSVEAEVHKNLHPYKHETCYRKQGSWVDCRELFDCDVEVAYEALHAIVASK
jgi:hypothetical protein